MSLILRQKTEQLLKDAGLPEFHVQINNKYLTIVGQCGQTIVTARGIQFSKNVPSNAEIDYAVELFTAFLERHVDTLREYKEARMAEKVAIDLNAKMISTIKAPLRSGGNALYLDIETNNSIQLILGQNGELAFYLGALKQKGLADWEGYVKLMKKYAPLAKNALEADKEVNKASIATNVIRNKLSTCNI